MNKLRECPDCSNEVSPRAESCPHCGLPFVRRKAQAQHGVFYYVFFGILSVIATMVILTLSCTAIGIGGSSYFAAQNQAAREQAAREQPLEVQEEQLKIANSKFEAKLAKRAAAENLPPEHAIETTLPNEQASIATRLKVTEFIEAKAKSGSGEYQLRLAKRYLAGEGVEADRTRASFWAMCAFTNETPGASNLLYQISNQ